MSNGIAEQAWPRRGTAVTRLRPWLADAMGAAGPPLLFETMIFNGPDDGEYQERCSTWEEAEAMHERAVHVAQQSDDRTDTSGSTPHA